MSAASGLLILKTFLNQPGDTGVGVEYIPLQLSISEGVHVKRRRGSGQSGIIPDEELNFFWELQEAKEFHGCDSRHECGRGGALKDVDVIKLGSLSKVSGGGFKGAGRGRLLYVLGR